MAATDASGRTQTFAFTTLALTAFAANSILCRIALRQGTVDPATFTSIRLVSGAVTLLAISRLTHVAARSGKEPGAFGSWRSGAILTLYAVPFSFAYVRLSVGTGALIMFGAVQATMLIAAVCNGDRPHAVQWIGLGVALAGLVYLVLPGLEAPPPIPAALMAIAGICWGLYSLSGQRGRNPLQRTAGNFIRAVPCALLVSLVMSSRMHAEPTGVLLSLASGAIASGLGYVVWYSALPHLSSVRAASVQLAVPVLAATGGVLFLDEAVPARLALAALMILGGIALSIFGGQPLI